MAFIALCEGYLGIEPHFELWRYFSVSLLKKRDRAGDLPVPMGYVGIHLRGQRSTKYMPCQLLRSNKRWHAQWFYVKNATAAPLSDFTRCLIEEAL